MVVCRFPCRQWPSVHAPWPYVCQIFERHSNQAHDAVAIETALQSLGANQFHWPLVDNEIQLIYHTFVYLTQMDDVDRKYDLISTNAMTSYDLYDDSDGST